MIVVIIAGGSGTRLWPLSTPDYPKHLLKINGDKKSLLQNTYERAKLLSDKIYVVTEGSHAHHVKDQLPELGDEAFIIEPARRGTANCFVAAIAYVAKKYDKDESIAFIHADHYIRDVQGFSHSFKVASDASKATGRIVLVGVEPDHPSTGFGYIQKDKLLDEANQVYEVHSFKEKPDYNTALKYIRSGKYIWNCGYFVGSANTFSEKMKQHAPELYANLEALSGASDEDYEKTYLSFENDAIDYALLEKSPDLLVVPASFDWMDVGSFADLHKAVALDLQGNYATKGYIELEGAENSYIENHEDKPVAVL